MQHPEEGIIHAWLDGALPANEAAALEAHVASCDACSALVAEARGLIAGASRIVGYLDVVPANVIPVTPPAKKRLYLVRSAWPAAIAASLIIAVGLYNSRGRDAAPVLSDAVNTEPSSAAPAPPAAPMSIGPQLETSATMGRRSGAEVERIAAVRTPEAVALDSNVLPPAGAITQKASVPAAPPSVSPLTSAGAGAAAPAAATGAVAGADARSEVLADSARLLRALGGGGGGGGRGTGAVGGTARRAPAQAQAARDFAMVDQAAAEAVRAAVGCYELNASTDVLPARFALTADSAAVPGLLSIRYLDAEDRLAPPIIDLGWRPSGGSITVRNAAGMQLLTMVKTASGVTGESPNGQRNGRVLSCR